MTARTGSGTIGAPAERVFDYFANPRNLVMANNRGPVIDQSVPSTGPGSWAVLKFDQLQLRVEYETWERPTKLAAVLHYSGIGSGNRVDRFAYDFAGAGDRTILRYRLDGGPSVNLPVIGAWLDRRYWQRIERRI